MGIDGGRQVGSVGRQRHWLCLLSKKLVPYLSAIQIIKAQENKVPVYLGRNFFKKRFYLFIHRDTERGRDTGRGRSRLHAGSLTWDSIPGVQITPQAEGGAKPLGHQGCPRVNIFKSTSLV